MLITRATDYAVRILVALSNASGERMKTSKLVATTAIPKEYASKVIRMLARRGWLEARRGAGGGFTLARPAENLTLLDVVELFEGPVQMHVCTGPSGCQFSSRCPVHVVWLEAENRLRRFLAGHRIAELAANSRGRGLFIPERNDMVATIRAVT